MEPSEMKSAEVTREKLVQDFKVIIRDTEQLLRTTADDMGERAKAVRERLNTALAEAKTNCQRLEERARESARTMDRSIRDHPYHSVGIAFGAGILFGVLLNRR